MKEEGIPFKRVPDNSLVIKKVMNIPDRITPVIIIDVIAEDFHPEKQPAKNMVMTEIRAGKRPLHGIKLLVNTARSLSRGESMILHPVTPTALQPIPMAMERHCFPQALHF